VVGTLHTPKVWHAREFRFARKRAGLRETLRLHDLRHYAVSCLIEQGAPILVVAKIAGHADPSITLRVYAHLLEGALAEAADRYDPLARSRGIHVASARPAKR
jgi:integrase